jgi:hypothetical protein
MLYTMDGNDSLKRVLRRTQVDGDDGAPVLGPSSELPSTRIISNDRYLTREYIDKWAKGVVQEMLGDIDKAS